MYLNEIHPQIFFAIQMVADVVLCIAVVFIFTRIQQDLKKRTSFEKTLAALQRLIVESQKTTAGLLEAMEDSKKALRDMSLSIEEKEVRLNRLIEQANTHIDKLDKTSAGIGDTLPGKKYDEVLRLAGQGLPPAEISQNLDLSEGEVQLIIDLSRRRSENR